jgi:hypothetical protein
VKKDRRKTDRKKEFIRAVAKFISGSAGTKSVLLEMAALKPVPPWKVLVDDWVNVFNAAGSFGYATEEETVKRIEELLK